MKKVFFSILVLVIALSLCACGGNGDANMSNDPTEPSAPEAPPSTKELTFEPNSDLSGYTVTGLDGIPSSTDIVIPDTYNGHPVTAIAPSAFNGYTGLTSITIPDSVTSVGTNAFRNCTSLTSVYITDVAAWCNIDFNYPGGNPLYYAKNLYLNGELVANLVIPDSVTSIGVNAFRDCTSLTSVTIPDSVTSIGYGAFDGCESLIYNTYDNADYLGNANNPYVLLMKASTKNITACNIHENTKVIYNSAFQNCTSLTSVTIPDSATSIGYDAFSGCTSLTSVTIGNGVTSIGASAFYWCTILTSVTIPASVTSIDNAAFMGCTSLTSITIPDSVTYIDEYAFGFYPKLTICGSAGSYAESFANGHGIPFVAQ